MKLSPFNFRTLKDRVATLFIAIVAACPAICAFTLLPASVHASPPQYTVTVLGLVGEQNAGFGINASGQVAGSAYDPVAFGYRAVRWTGITPTKLDAFGGSDDNGVAINASGQVAGRGYPAGGSYFHAVRWTGTAAEDLIPFSGGNESVGYGINSSGQVAGNANHADGSFHATTWTGTTPNDLDPSGSDSRAFGINDSGAVAGYARLTTNSPFQAVRWVGGSATPLDNLAGPNSYGFGINASGQVVGYAELADNSIRAVLWTGTTAVNLGTLGGSGSLAYAINADGDVTGMSETTGDADFVPFIYTGGTMYNLRNLIVSGPAVDNLTFDRGQGPGSGGGINDLGQIAATATYNGEYHAVLLTRVTTPPPTDTIVFEQASYTHVANDTEIFLTVTRSDTTTAIDVPFTLEGGTAVLGAAGDYTGGTGVDQNPQAGVFHHKAHFDIGFTTATISFFGNLSVASAKTIVVTLSPPTISDHWVLGTPAVATVTLTPHSTGVVSPLLVSEQTLDIRGKNFPTTEVAVGDKVSYVITVKNKGTDDAKNVVVETLIPSAFFRVETPPGVSVPANPTTYLRQFIRAEVKVGPGGKIYDTGKKTAQNIPILGIRWKIAGALGMGELAKKSVYYTVEVSELAKLDSTISNENEYSVASSTNQPAGTATPTSSGSANVTTTVRTALQITASVQPATTVAPGGLLTYHFTITNLANFDKHNAVMAINLPEFTRFVGFLDDKGAMKDSPPGLRAKIVHYSSDQLLVFVGKLDAKGYELSSRTVHLVLQAKWAEPAALQKIVIPSYAAGFLSKLTPIPKKIFPFSAYAKFLFGMDDLSPDVIAHLRLLDPSVNPRNTDYVAFVEDLGNSSASAHDNSGSIESAFIGSAAGGPDLGLAKLLSSKASDTEDDGLGDAIDTVQAGDRLTFLLLAVNNGKAPAEDVFIQDAMPEHCTYIAGSAKLLGSTPSTMKSNLSVIPDGAHMGFAQLHLDPADSIAIEYTVLVASGADAPAVGTFLDPPVATVTDADGVKHLATSSIATSSTPHTSFGLYVNGPIKVVGSVQFALELLPPMNNRPRVTGDVGVTADALTAFYTRLKSKSDPHPESDLPMTNPADVDSFIPGAERFYIHYENSGAAVNNVKLEVPLPAHTAFYRASFVTLTPSQTKGARGNMPGVLISLPKDAIITPPAGLNNGFLATGGTVTFNFTKLPKAGASGSSGDVMVELIVMQDAVQSAGSLLCLPGEAPVVLHDAASHQVQQNFTPLVLASPRIANPVGSASFRAFIAASPAAPPPPQIPELGILKIVPQVVASGGDFYMNFIIFNYGDSASSSVDFLLPTLAGATFVGPGFTQLYNGQHSSIATGERFTWDSIPAHSAVAITEKMHAVGASGTSIIDSGSRMFAPYLGVVSTDVTQTSIGATSISAAAAARITTSISGRPLHTYFVDDTHEVEIVELGGGNVVARAESLEIAGATSLVFWDSHAVNSGSSAQVNLGGVTAAFLLSHPDRASLAAVRATPPITAVPSGVTFKIPRGANGIAAGGGYIVAQGGGNIVAQGGGNLIGQDGGTIVAQGGGNVVVQGLIGQDGGTLIGQDGGTVVAQGGGNLIGNDGGTIVAQGGGNILASSPSSSLTVNLQGGNVVAQGGGNAVAQGGGN